MNRFIAIAVAVIVLAVMTLVGRQVSAADDDRKAVAELDTEYQTAVKKNDAAMMDRILADDFVLVTASGKTYTKADFLNDARGGRTVYEHQEDTMQTVRVWGDAAAVTARLWEKGSDHAHTFDHTLRSRATSARTPPER